VLQKTVVLFNTAFHSPPLAKPFLHRDIRRNTKKNCSRQALKYNFLYPFKNFFSIRFHKGKNRIKAGSILLYSSGISGMARIRQLLSENEK
jgi:hypothetical protein